MGSLELASRSFRRIDDLLAGEPARQQLGLEPDQVVDEDDVVDEQLGQLQVAGRLGVAQADRVERDPLARGELGRLGEAASPSVVWPSVSSTIAEGGTPRSSVRTWRTPSPRRDWPPVASTLRSFSTAGATSSGLSTSASGRAGRRDEVEPDLVLLLELAEDLRVVPRQPALRDREPARLGVPGLLWPAPSAPPCGPAGSAYWSTTCPLAESSTMTTKYGRPVRSTESTASESMKTASRTRVIRSAASPIL